MSTTTLASLALLKANIETEGRDVLDMVAPLVEFAGSKRGLTEGFSTADLKKATVDELGLVLPERAIDLILRRMQRRGLASRESGRYSVTSWAIDTVAIEDAQAELLRRSSDVVEHLRTFVGERHQIPWSSEDARSALDSYIDAYSIDCIRAHAAASPVPVQGRSPSNAQFLVSSYANALSETDSARFGLLVDIVKGRMLANAVLGEDLVDQKQSFKGTTLFLDTPLVLRVSGLSGPEAERLAMDVVELGRKAGASWGVFEHTLEEADAVLREVQRKLEFSYEGHGDVYLHAKESGHSASDITLLRSRLLELLQEKGVQLHATPRYVASLQIDEKALEDECRSAGLHHGNQAALRYDINSIRSIFVLRSNSRPRKLEDSRAVLVTSNSALARGAFAYGKRHEASREVSTVITEYSLANLLWLKWPLHAPEVPKHVLAASCHAALRPSGRLWRAFLGEVEKLDKMGKLSPEQHAFLRFESRVRGDLMDLTLGDEGTLDSDTVLRILSAYEEDIARPFKDEADAEKARRAAAERSLQESLKSSQQLEEQLAVERDRQARLKRSVAWWARTAGRGAALVCFAIGAALIATGLIWLTPEGGGLVAWLPSGGLMLAGLATVVLSFLNLAVGVTLRTPVAWLRSWVERRVYRMLAQRVELDLEDDADTSGGDDDAG
ncbi:MAG: hypothetical protein KC766_03010 [Myxococcales bacterium]|nr:hypothetical protein [Myxococcales bacterium]